MVRAITVALGLALVVGLAPAWAGTGGPDHPPVGMEGSGQPFAGMSPLDTEGYGTTDNTVLVVAPTSFIAEGGTPFWLKFGYFSAVTGDTSRSFFATVNLPTGALLQSLWACVRDDSDTGYVHVRFLQQACPGSTVCTQTTLADIETGEADTPDFVTLPSFDMYDTTWLNYDSAGNVNYGYILVYLSEATSNLEIGPIMVVYKRQVSPAPATATFDDVPTDHWAFRFVEALAASGITAGCGGDNYCPDDPITRAQMAVYLAAALGLHYPG